MKNFCSVGISRLKKKNKDLKLTRITTHGKRSDHLWGIMNMSLGPILLNILRNNYFFHLILALQRTQKKRKKKPAKNKTQKNKIRCVRYNSYI